MRKIILVCLLVLFSGCHGIDLDLESPGHNPVEWDIGSQDSAISQGGFWKPGDKIPENGIIMLSEEQLKKIIMTSFWLGVLEERRANSMDMYVSPTEPWKLDPNDI
jgi:hypothetical protein